MKYKLMKVKIRKHTATLISTLLFSVILFGFVSGCSSEETAEAAPQLETAETDSLTNQPPLTDSVKLESSGQTETNDTEKPTEETAGIDTQTGETDPSIANVSQMVVTVFRPEWASYFDTLNGTAVILDPEENSCMIYNEALADTRRSPCSTFKIISSLAGLESSAINPEHSTRTWSGEVFWNDDWNQDMVFSTAFHTSCVWYYRQVIDDIGAETIQDTLDSLHYGNCDITDWEGHLNHNNQNPSLTGFWIESSLRISPREQTEVMYQIFGPSSEYSPDILSALEEVMFLSQDSKDDCAIYGKTGMGKSNGVVVDAWYTGFTDVGRRLYFCVYLGETEGADVSSTRAREIAVSLIKENF